MDSFELNKIIGAILGTLLFVMGVGFLAEAIYQPSHGPGPGYDLPEPVATDTGTGDTTAAPVQVADIGTLLAAADAKAGEAASKKCQACHDFSKGGPNKTGPNLYGIVGEKIADVPGYAFSAALMAHSGETWTYENLNTWLISPKAYAPGTKMTYAGDKDDKDRANIIAYLGTLSDAPVAYPAPAAPAAPEAPASSQVVDNSSAAAPAVTSSEAPTTSSAPASSSAAAPAPASSEAPVAASSSSAPAPAAVSSAPAAPAPSSSEAPAPAPSSSAAPAAVSSSSAAPAPAPSSSVVPPASSSAAQ